jgi:flavorubredoxin
MDTTVTEIAPSVYRISTFHTEYGIQFNQFLVDDDEPFLMHTGFRKMFPLTFDAVAKVMQPSKLRWIGYSHFEPDECGALNEWLAAAPQATPVCGVVGQMVMLNDYSDRPASVLQDGEAFGIGKRKLRFLATPHVPHGWDAGLFFEESDATLFCSDLFFHAGETKPLSEDDVVGAARASMEYGAKSPLAKDIPYTPYTDATLARLAALKPRTLALMHGASYRGDGEKALSELRGAVKEFYGEA